MYEKARRGESIELSPRRISIFQFEIERSLDDRLLNSARCFSIEPIYLIWDAIFQSRGLLYGHRGCPEIDLVFNPRLIAHVFLPLGMQITAYIEAPRVSHEIPLPKKRSFYVIKLIVHQIQFIVRPMGPTLRQLILALWLLSCWLHRHLCIFLPPCSFSKKMYFFSWKQNSWIQKNL